MKQKVLVIDDEPSVRKVLRRILETAGFLVEEASDGREGVRCFRHTAVDLVITDLLMPEMEGLDTIRTIKRQDNAAKIIAISGGGMISGDLYLGLAGKLGAGYMLEKPICPQQLIDAVNLIIANPD